MVTGRPKHRHLSLRMVIVVGLGLALMLGASSGLLAQTDGGQKDAAIEPVAAPTAEQRLRVLLSGYDYFPTRDELLAVSPDAPRILVSIYQDEAAKPTTKLRVIDALGYFSDDETRAFFAYLLENDSELESRHLHHAITAYAKAFGEQAVALETRFLKHDDAQVRLTAVVALSQFGGVPARTLLHEHLKIEQSPLVREKIEALK